MDKETLLKTLYDKENWQVWRNFQEIQNSIKNSNELYKYFDEIQIMLSNEKSYIKMRAFLIICELSKWDKDNKINTIADELLELLTNEKPTIVRICLKSISTLLLYKPDLSTKVKSKLKSIDLSIYKDTMSPLIKKDIATILSK